MSKSARQSKFRHIFGEPAKPELQYEEIKNPLSSGEGQYVKANSKFFAVAKTGGGGPIYVRRLNRPGRLPPNCPTLDVHSGKVLDFDFHPFADNLIATASEDTRVCVTQFPMDGLNDNISSPTVTLKGHEKKVALCEFNPVANNILASGAYDKSVKIWNIETADCVTTYNDLGDNIYSLAWNYDGSQLVITGKDKLLRMVDPRDVSKATSFECFDGTKSSKAFWIQNLNWIGACGFSKTAKRQLKIWDLKNLSEPIYKMDIDQGASVLMPYYDKDLSVLYLAGKGDGSIQYFELVDDDRKVYSLNVFRDPTPQKGGSWVPKKGLDVWKCEVARFLKLTNKSIVPISFMVPRKAGADIFQDDIFPEAFAGKAALTAAEWIKGENKNPVLMSLDPSKREDKDSAIVFEKKMTYGELEEENSVLRRKIDELEQELNKYRGNDNNNDNNNNDNNNNDNNNNDNNTEQPTNEDTEAKEDE